MKALLIRLVLLMSLFLAGRASAATRAVFQGQSIQAAIDACAAGDTVIIFEGTYVEDLTINKLVQLAKPAGKEVVLGGSVTLTGLTAPYILHDFRIGIDRTKRLNVHNCSYVTLQDLNLNDAHGFASTNTTRLTVLRVTNAGGTASSVVDSGRFETKGSVIGGTLTLTRANSILRQGTYGAVKAEQGDFFLLGGTATGTVSVSGQSKAGLAGTGVTNAVFFQANVEDRLTSSASYCWVGYNNLKFVTLTGGSYAVFVGNDVNGKTQPSAGWPCGIRVSETSGSLRVKINNNVIRKMGVSGATPNYQGSGWQWGGAGVWIQAGGQIDIFNNVFEEITGQNGAINTGDEGGVGVYVQNNRSYNARVSVRGNIFSKMASVGTSKDFLCAIRAPADNVVFADNAVHMIQGQRAKGGVVDSDPQELTLTSAPVFLDGEYRLRTDSPLRNKGPEDARFNDFDPSPNHRNDLGRWGGTQYDPLGRTTTKPVVFGFDITPDQVLEGTATQIKLMNIGAVMIEP